MRKEEIKSVKFFLARSFAYNSLYCTPEDLAEEVNSYLGHLEEKREVHNCTPFDASLQRVLLGAGAVGEETSHCSPFCVEAGCGVGTYTKVHIREDVYFSRITPEEILEMARRDDLLAMRLEDGETRRLELAEELAQAKKELKELGIEP